MNRLSDYFGNNLKLNNMNQFSLNLNNVSGNSGGFGSLGDTPTNGDQGNGIMKLPPNFINNDNSFGDGQSARSPMDSFMNSQSQQDRRNQFYKQM
mmetsp:Transcript_11588/g.10099  ORF Transcript_11588/g.10099 Transcript_11588/m.10099 type:complete len:95 (-) Transcript_11588:848-1132(-)